MSSCFLVSYDRADGTALFDSSFSQGKEEGARKSGNLNKLSESQSSAIP